jgi:hypothetical protein
MTGLAIAVPLLAAGASPVDGGFHRLLHAFAVRGHTVSLLNESYHGPPYDHAGVRVCPGFYDLTGADAEELRYWWLVRMLRKRVPVDVVLTVGAERPPPVVDRALAAAGLAAHRLHLTATRYADEEAAHVTAGLERRLRELARHDLAEGAECEA